MAPQPTPSDPKNPKKPVENKVNKPLQSRSYDTKSKKWVTSDFQDWTPDERKRYGVSPTGGIDSFTANAILRERRALAMGAPTSDEITKAEEAAYNATNNANSGNGGQGGAGYANLLKSLTGLGNYAAGNVNSSMDELTRTLQAQANPFANYQAQSTSTTPELSQLLQSQGVSQDPLRQYAATVNAQNAGQASAFQNQANVMRDIYGANQAGSISDVGQQRNDLMNQLQGNILGTGQALMGKNAPDRNSILQMILQAMKVQR
jgi:hypothetical protein